MTHADQNTNPTLTTAAPSSDAKIWAVLSYASVFLGLPVGVIPMMQQEDPFALHHAKDATATYLVGVIATMALATVTMGLSFVTFGLSTIFMIPVVFLIVGWMVAAGVHGMVLALNGEWTTSPLAFGLGERIFGSIRVKAPTGQAAPAPEAVPAPGQPLA